MATAVESVSSSRTNLLRSAIAAIDEFGEAGVRVEEIGQRAGVSVATIYHWFDSKQGLIEAAQRMRFDAVWDATMVEEVQRFRNAVTSRTDAAAAQSGLLEFTAGLRNHDQDDTRMARLILIGASLHQPELRQLIAANYRTYLADGIRVLTDCSGRPGFRNDLDAPMSTASFHSQAISRRICEIGPSSLDPHRSDVFRDQAMAWTLWGVGVTRSDDTREDQRVWAGAMRPTAPPSDHTTERLILDRVIEHIDEHGEGSLRLRRITRDLHFSETVIHRYFGGREGLVTRAQAVRFETSVGIDLAAFDDSVRACADADEFKTILRVMLRSRLSDDKKPLRLRRLSALGAVHRRPGLAETYRSILDDETFTLAKTLDLTKQRGWVRASLDSAGYAAWLNSMCIVHACLEIDDMGFDPSDFCAHQVNCAVEVLTTEPHTIPSPI